MEQLKITPIYYPMVLYIRNLVPYSSGGSLLPILKGQNQGMNRAAFLSGSSGDESIFSFIQDVGSMQVLMSVGLRPQFLADCQRGIVLMAASMLWSLAPFPANKGSCVLPKASVSFCLISPVFLFCCISLTDPYAFLFYLLKVHMIRWRPPRESWTISLLQLSWLVTLIISTEVPLQNYLD